MLPSMDLSQLIQSSQPLLVDFYAEWCAPCKAIEPEIDALAERVKDRVTVIRVDVEKYLQEALKYEVRGVPTFMLFVQGKMVWKHAGVLSGKELEELLGSHLLLR
jgi:thioredoxin 1